MARRVRPSASGSRRRRGPVGRGARCPAGRIGRVRRSGRASRCSRSCTARTRSRGPRAGRRPLRRSPACPFPFERARPSTSPWTPARTRVPTPPRRRPLRSPPRTPSPTSAGRCRRWARAPHGRGRPRRAEPPTARSCRTRRAAASRRVCRSRTAGVRRTRRSPGPGWPRPRPCRRARPARPRWPARRTTCPGTRGRRCAR